MMDRDFSGLEEYLSKIPSVRNIISHELHQDKTWWVKLSIDVDHDLTWQTVQELGHVLNYLSLEERLPTLFYPISPPPYLNGGPADFLSWIITSTDSEFTPEHCRDWLTGRLPDPVNDRDAWEN